MTDWHCIMTRTAKEFEVRDGLNREGFETFLPTVKGERKPFRHAKRKEPVEFPYFPGYLFAQIGNRWPEVLTLSYVYGILSSDGRFACLSQSTLDEIARQCALYAPQKPIGSIRPGMVVRITEGPLALYTATVGAVQGNIAELLFPMLGRDRVRIDIDMLQVA